jgi:hypothetical protein
LAAAPLAGNAQCRSFAKNKCMPAMAPYKFNQTFNAAQLAPGEEAEVELTFYSGQEYRLLVCAHPILGAVNWKLADAAGTTLFESKADAPKDQLRLQGGHHAKADGTHRRAPSRPRRQRTCSPWVAWRSWWGIKSRHICRSEGINFPAGAAALQIPDS